MKVLLHSNGVPLAEQDRELFTTRLAGELSHLARIVNRVNVYFYDNNGPKGGCDKMCRLVIHLRRRTPVVIREQDSELMPLIYRLIERAGQAVRRRSTTWRERRHSISMSGE